MTEAPAMNSKSQPRPVHKAAVGRLFVLELSGGRIHSMSPDGSDRKVIVTDCRLPDGIAVDVEAGHVYWTNMGSSPSTNDGSIERADLDGKNRRVIVPLGSTFTPKQIQLDKKNGKLYEPKRIEQARLIAVLPPHHRRLQPGDPWNQRNHCSATFSSLFRQHRPVADIHRYPIRLYSISGSGDNLSWVGR